MKEKWKWKKKDKWLNDLDAEIEQDLAAIGSMEINGDDFRKTVPLVGDLIDKRNDVTRNKTERIKAFVPIMTTALAGLLAWCGTVYSDKFDQDHIRDKEAGKIHLRNWVGLRGK